MAINMPSIADLMKSEPFERERKQIEEKKEEKPKSSSCTQVEYGSTDLSQKAINYRKDNNIKGTRNVAVFEYEDKEQLA